MKSIFEKVSHLSLRGTVLHQNNAIMNINSTFPYYEFFLRNLMSYKNNNITLFCLRPVKTQNICIFKV